APAEARPAIVSVNGSGSPPLGPPDTDASTATSANGPAAAVTCGSLAVAASSAAVVLAGSTVTDRCAPRCAANALSNGPSESTISAAASTQAAVVISNTTAITIVCTLRRTSPPTAGKP